MSDSGMDDEERGDLPRALGPLGVPPPRPAPDFEGFMRHLVPRSFAMALTQSTL